MRRIGKRGIRAAVAEDPDRRIIAQRKVVEINLCVWDAALSGANNGFRRIDTKRA